MSKQRRLWIAPLFFLLMGLAHFSCAELGQKEQVVEQTLENRLQTNVPQTPEELLQVLKDLLANPDVDGKEFCEKRLGIDRNRGWVESNASRTIYKEYLVTSLGSTPFPPASFHFQEAAINRQDKLSVLVLTFYKHPSFGITPALTRQILGEPDWIGVSHPKVDVSRGQYRITYRFLSKVYLLHIEFWNEREANNREMKYLFRKHTPEQIQSERECRIPFVVHKDYQPTEIELRRIERP